MTRPGSSCGVVGQFVNAGAQVACTFTASFTGGAGATLTNTVTAAVITTAPSAETAVASGTATITITDSPPALQVTYTASPVAQPTPGGTFTFTVAVKNVGLEPVTITRITDIVYGGLATRPGSTCGALIGTTLAPGATSAPCTFTGTFTGPGGEADQRGDGHGRGRRRHDRRRRRPGHRLPVHHHLHPG